MLHSGMSSLSQGNQEENKEDTTDQTINNESVKQSVVDEGKKTVKEKCKYCGVTDQRLFRCARCKTVFYCNRNHQRLHWTIHKPECIPTTINKGSGSDSTAGSTSTNSSQKIFPSKPIVRPHSKTPSANLQQTSPTNTRYSVRDYDMNMDDYNISASPAIFKIPQDDDVLVDREVFRKYADRVVHCMLNEGYCVIDNFLGEINAAKVLWDVINICRSGIMKPGQVIAKSKQPTKKIRGDVITWITGQEEAYENMNLIMNHVDRLVRYCTGRLGNIKGRTPAMVACYPGDGSGYKRHIDNITKDGRSLSCLYYLNKGWQADVNGGQLRLFPFARQDHVDIEPNFDRFTMFWSDRRTPHKVLPAFCQRYAVTLWYFNAVEREKVKEKYFSNLKNSFAASVSVDSGSKPSTSSMTPLSSIHWDQEKTTTSQFEEEEYVRVPTVPPDE